MKTRRENGKIYLTLNYNPDFTGKLKRYCAAKWQPDSKEWMIDEEFEKKANELLLKEYGFKMDSEEKIQVEYMASDFYNTKTGVIEIEGIIVVKRYYRDQDVETYRDTVILEGGFPSRGGSAKYPDVSPEKGTKLRSTLYFDFYNILSDEVKAKLTVINDKKAPSEKEKLEARKVELEAELLAINEKLAALKTE